MGASVLVVLTVLMLMPAPLRASGAAATSDMSADTTAMQPPPAQDEFVPIAELPPEDRLPAAPLLVAAYAFVWIALVGYLWSIWRRVGRVEQELAEVGRRVRKTQER